MVFTQPGSTGRRILGCGLGMIRQNRGRNARRRANPHGVLRCRPEAQRYWGRAWSPDPVQPEPSHVRRFFGRLIDAINDLGIMDDTLIYLIIGDNGASAEGTINGCFNEMCTLNGMPGIETTEFLLSKIDKFGTPYAYNHNAVGWAHALCAPYDGKPVGKGRVEKTQPMGYSADEACDVGADTGSPASPEYGVTGNSFSGKIEWVQIDVGKDDHDHLISAEERLKVAMARQ